MENFLKSLPDNFELHEFKLERVLGQGGFGITYLALDMNLMQHVAIKEYYPREFANRDTTFTIHAVGNAEDKDTFAWGLKRFLDEARVLAQLNHPNIITVKRFFEAHGTAYLVMEYCDGKPLDEIIRDHGPLNETELNEILFPLLDGLEHVHEKAFLHRDIKPANIFIRRNGSPVLLDFGAAKHEMTSHSKSVTSLATAGYAPFEQYSTKGKQGPWSDIYGLAATIYRSISGVKPQDAPDRMLEDTLEPAVKLLKDKFDSQLLLALDKALSIRPAARPQTIAEFRNLMKSQQVSFSDSGTPAPSARSIQSFEPEFKLTTLADPYFSEGMAMPEDKAYVNGLVGGIVRSGRKNLFTILACALMIAAAWFFWMFNTQGQISQESNSTIGVKPKEAPSIVLPIVSEASHTLVEEAVKHTQVFVKAPEEKKVTPQPMQVVVKAPEEKKVTPQPMQVVVNAPDENKITPQPMQVVVKTPDEKKITPLPMQVVVKTPDEKKVTPSPSPSLSFDEIDIAIDSEQFSKAKSLLSELITNNPDSAAAHFRLGQIFAKEDNYTQARVQLNNAKRIDPSLRFTSLEKYQALFNEILAMEKMTKLPRRD